MNKDEINKSFMLITFWWSCSAMLLVAYLLTVIIKDLRLLEMTFSVSGFACAMIGVMYSYLRFWRDRE